MSKQAMILKSDAGGRVVVPLKRQLELVREFERSGLSGPRFAVLAGLKYQTFAGWRRRHGLQPAQRRRPTAPQTGGASVEVTHRSQAVLAAQLFADDAATQEPRGLVVELFGDLFADGAPSFRISNDLIRPDHFIHGGQMLRHTCFALLAWFDLRTVLAALLDLSLQDAWACAGGFGFFCAVISLEQQHELAVIELFAAAPKDAPDEQIHFFAQKFVLQGDRSELMTKRLHFLGESCFQRRHHAEMMKSRRCTNLVLP